MKLTLFGFTFRIARQRPREIHEPRKFRRPDHEASDAFWDAFQFGGTLVCQCACGRTLFCSNTDLDYDDGELERLLARAAEHPDRYIENSIDSSLAVMDMPAGSIVWGCPCHGARRHESFLEDWRQQIVDYYIRVDKKKRAELEELTSQLEQVNG